MKFNKLFAVLAAFALSVCAVFAQDSRLDKIQKAGNAVSRITADFVQTRIIVASGKVVKSSGKLHYTDKGQLSMQYVKPAGDVLVIDGSSMYLSRSGKVNNFDLSKNKLMSSLSSMLLGCIAGNAEQVAGANNADISVSESGNDYVVTMKARTQAVRGYSDIVLNYRKSDCLLVKMDITEFSGIRNVYEMSSVDTRTAVDGAVFSIPR